MGYFDTVVKETRVVDITGGYTVTVGRLNKRDSDYCAQILTGSDEAKTRLVTHSEEGKVGSTSEQVTDLNLRHRAYRTACLERGIRAWTLDDGAAIAPIDVSHIDQLLEADANKVFIAIKKFDEAVDPDKLGN